MCLIYLFAGCLGYNMQFAVSPVKEAKVAIQGYRPRPSSISRRYQTRHSQSNIRKIVIL